MAMRTSSRHLHQKLVSGLLIVALFVSFVSPPTPLQAASTQANAPAAAAPSAQDDTPQAGAAVDKDQHLQQVARQSASAALAPERWPAPAAAPAAPARAPLAQPSDVTADFSADPLSGVVPLTVTFEDQSSADTAAIDHWQWDFGDGQSSTEQYPIHTYSAGSYTVSLTVESAGIPATLTRSNYIHGGARSALTIAAPANTQTIDDLAIAENPAALESLIVWTQWDASQHDVFAQRVDGAGAPLGDIISVAADSNDDFGLAVGYNADSGRYLVVWVSRQGEALSDLYGQLIDPDGALVGAGCSFKPPTQAVSALASPMSGPTQ